MRLGSIVSVERNRRECKTFDAIKAAMRRIVREEVAAYMEQADLTDKLFNITSLIEENIAVCQKFADRLCNSKEAVNNVATIILSEDCCSRYIPSDGIDQSIDAESGQMREKYRVFLQ